MISTLPDEPWLNNEKAAQAFMEQLLHPDGYTCSKCGCREFYRYPNKMTQLRCNNCRYEISWRADTMMHRTRAPNVTWTRAIWLMLFSGEVISNSYLASALDCSHKVAAELRDRIEKSGLRRKGQAT